MLLRFYWVHAHILRLVLSLPAQEDRAIFFTCETLLTTIHTHVDSRLETTSLASQWGLHSCWGLHFGSLIMHKALWYLAWHNILMQYGLPLRITAILATSFLVQHYLWYWPYTCLWYAHTSLLTNMVVVGVEPALAVCWDLVLTTHTPVLLCEILLNACTHTSD